MAYAPASFAVNTDVPFNQNSPVYIEANDMHYDQNRELVVASGKVEVTQGPRILRSDLLLFDEKNNVVRAKGNVSILEPDGTVYFAKSVDLRDDLKAGVVRHFRARLSDGSLFAANQARKINETKTTLDKAVYSPCKVCKEPGHDPLWQIKADKVTIDDEAQRITYRNAFFELYGVPVLYTPYLSHASPDADRESGILTPTYSVSTALGGIVEVPYYVNIAPNLDATITPMITTREGTVMAGEFRHLTTAGAYELQGSITYPRKRDAVTGAQLDGNEVRGHIEGEGKFRISDHWQWGFKGKHTTDDTYLRRYGFGNEDTLTSRVYAEGIRGRNYASMEGLAFQGLNIDDDPATTPLVLPLMESSYESAPDYLGGRVFASGNIMALHRSLGPESRRLSGTIGWRKPIISHSGHVWELSTHLRGDGYSVNNAELIENGLPVQEDKTVGRFIPEASLSWRYPLVRPLESGGMVTLEPVVQFIASPNGNNPDEIPNEDSQVLEFGASNLFRLNRFTGLDRVEEGMRVNYGVRGSAYLDGDRHIELLFGQNYRLHNSSNYTLGTALDDNFSDYVGMARLHYNVADIAYRFRLEQDDFTPRRNEVNAGLNLYPVSFSADYISLNNDPTLADRQELFAAASLALTEQWSLMAHGHRDLSTDGGMVSAGGGLQFQNECLTLLTLLHRDFTRDRDIEPATLFTVQVSLKNLN